MFLIYYIQIVDPMVKSFMRSLQDEGGGECSG
jgi:hypothetical protein